MQPAIAVQAVWPSAYATAFSSISPTPGIAGVAERTRCHKWTKMSQQVLERRAMATEGHGVVAPGVKTAMHD